VVTREAERVVESLKSGLGAVTSEGRERQPMVGSIVLVRQHALARRLEWNVLEGPRGLVHPSLRVAPTRWTATVSATVKPHVPRVPAADTLLFNSF
jgi:hypothetical protein